ncbi:MAG TPA: YjiH family protein [Acidobacteriota bacterium]|nr:YjiH family protein [Acidobacteriota bacterium]
MSPAEEESSQKTHFTGSTCIKFIGFSLFGILLFFVPIPINGVNSIPLDHLITFINTVAPHFGPLFTLCIVVTGGIVPWFTGTFRKGTTAFVISLFRALGVPVAVMAFFGMGPAWLLDPGLLPFVWERIVVSVTVIVVIGSIFLTFIIAFGLMEFVGMIMRPVLRPLYKVPGKAAVDAVASFVGSFSVAIYLTNKLYTANKYTNKEACIIMTGFSTVSVTFMIIVARTAGFMEMWNFYFFSTLIITFTVTALVVRMWPITGLDDSYRDGKGDKEVETPGNLFLCAVRAGLKSASETKPLHQNLWENFKGGIVMCFTLSPCIASIALLAFILVQMTPLFDILGLVFVPLTYVLSLMGLPEHLTVAKACTMVLGEMFVPNVVVSSLPDSSKYVVAVVSVSAILFFGGSIPCILATDVKLKTWQILIIWFERTALSILFAGITALLVFR